MKTRTGIIATIISLSLVLAMVGTSFATPVTTSFSGSTSDETDPSLLNAEVTFEFTSTNDPGTEGTLAITVSNMSDFTISELYFNLSENLDTDALAFSGYSDDTGDPLNPELSFQQNKNTEGVKAGGFGEYDVLLDFYVKDKKAGHNSGANTGVGSGEEFTFYLAVTGSAPLSESDFLVSSSPELVLKFTQGPDDDSAFAASGSVPEPGTMLLLGTGLVCLAGLGRKKLLKK
jgi:hypothetical protein